MTVLVELSGLCVRSPSRVLVEDVDLTLSAGRVTALVGPSGSGKSLTARACMGVLDVDPGIQSGRLIYPEWRPGHDWFAEVAGLGMKAQRNLLRKTRHIRGAQITYSPQSASSALNPARTIGRQLQLSIGRRAEKSEHPEREIREILDAVGLEPRVARSLPGELSGGMCQRAALAIAIAPRPRLVIADEPETGLDPVLRRAVVELLVEVCKGRGAGLLLISHNLDTVGRIADAVVELPGRAQDLVSP